MAAGGSSQAYLVDPAVRLNPFDRVELRAVELQKETGLAWEVYVRGWGAQLHWVPGQHCAPRTVPAEQWLSEIQTGILDELATQAERVRNERLAQEGARRAMIGFSRWSKGSATPSESWKVFVGTADASTR